MKPVRIFISHSERDRELAVPLSGWLQRGLGLDENEVRCTSVINMGGGSVPATVLRKDIETATAVIGLLTTNSLLSHWAQLEMGAGWFKDSLIPIRGPGIYVRDLPSPLSDLTTVDFCEQAEMKKLLSDLADDLGTKVCVDAKKEIEEIAESAKKTLVNNMVAWFTLPPVLSARRIKGVQYEKELRELCEGLDLDPEDIYPCTNPMGVLTQDPEQLPICAKNLWTVSKIAVNYLLESSTNKSVEFLDIPHGVLNAHLIADMKRALDSKENRAPLLRGWFSEAREWIPRNPPSENQAHSGSRHY